MSTLTRIRFQPNWMPSLNPPVFEMADRLMIDQTPRVQKRVQRAENPTVLMHSDVGFSFHDFDGLFTRLFDLDKIQGTDLANLRAPLLHFGRVLVQQQKRPGGNWKNLFFGYVEPRSLKISSDTRTGGFTAYSAGKNLDLGNAERVHRLTAVVATAPYVMLGLDLVFPSSLPGQTPNDQTWRLVGGAALPFFAGDVFQAVAKITAGQYVEGMQTNDLGNGDHTVASTAVSGADLLLYTVEHTPGITLSAGQASMDVKTPWYHNKTVGDLNQLLVDEVNAAMAAAGDADAVTLVQDPFAVSLGASAVDLIDGTGIGAPVTGSGWYQAVTASTRALAAAVGSVGTQKPDVLQDPTSQERTFPVWNVNTAVLIQRGTTGQSADYKLPQTYPNPSRTLPGSPPPALANAPAPGQSRVRIKNQGIDQGDVYVVSTAWHVTPPAQQTTPTTLKRAWRLDYSESAYVSLIGPPAAKVLTLINPRRLVVSLYTTTDDGQTWVVASTASSNGGHVQMGAQTLSFEDDNQDWAVFFEPGAQPFLSVHPVAGGVFLYVLLSPGDRKAYWRVGTVGDADGIAAASLLPGAVGNTAFGAQPGNRSGTVTDGTNIWFFDDSSEVRAFTGPGTAAGTQGSANLVGTGTTWNTSGPGQLFPGDVLQDVATQLFGRYVVQTVNSDTSITLTAAIVEANFTGAGYVVFHTGAMAFFWWNGTAMVPGTLVGFPVLNGADFQGAVVDPGRGKIYVMQAGVLVEIAYTFAAGTLTATAVAFNNVDTPNYSPADDFVPLSTDSSTATVSRDARLAWLTGPVDVVQGAGSGQANYPAARNALLVVTQTVPYVYSDQFGGVVRVADFSGLSCSQAMTKLAQITQQFVTAGPDVPLVADAANDAYVPVPTVGLRRRVPLGPPDVDLSTLAVSSSPDVWMVQYGDVRVQNSIGSTTDAQGLTVGGIVAEVRNDQVFVFGGVTYKVAAVRYAGATSLSLDNPFIFTTSLGKQIANAFAYEFLIKRKGAKIKVLDPFLLDDTTVLDLLQIAAYLATAPDSYAAATFGQNRILALGESPTDDIIDVEIA